jgi:hypothetical protein
MMGKKREIIVVHETVSQSWKRDAGSLVAATLAVTPGYLLDIEALTWVGAAMFALSTVSAAERLVGDGEMSIEDARKRIDEIERLEADG